MKESTHWDGCWKVHEKCAAARSKRIELMLDNLARGASIYDILETLLPVLGMDGLYNENGECACELSNLAPCGYPSFDCRIGKKIECGDLCEEFFECSEEDPAFHIVSPKIYEEVINKQFEKIEDESHGMEETDG